MIQFTEREFVTDWTTLTEFLDVDLEVEAATLQVS
jgi:hypothetical protein